MRQLMMRLEAALFGSRCPTCGQRIRFRWNHYWNGDLNHYWDSDRCPGWQRT